MIGILFGLLALMPSDADQKTANNDAALQHELVYKKQNNKTARDIKSSGTPLVLSKSKNLQVMSPQTADFVRYDNTDIEESTGRLSLSIPLIDFEDPDFEFPISVRYNFSGFRPAETDNFVGRNWSLDCGGMIYREIKGVPDEVKYETYYGQVGFLQTIRSHSYDDAKVKASMEK